LAFQTLKTGPYFGFQTLKTGPYFGFQPSKTLQNSGLQQIIVKCILILIEG
jgi:hypothetical protein